MNRSRRWSSILALAAAGVVLATFPTCRSTKHTVARIVTPAARPAEVFVPAPVEPPPPPATRVPPASPSAPPPSPTPTVAPMRVVTTPSAPADRSPGVLYEQLVPTAVAVTPIPTAVPVTPIPTAVVATPIPTTVAVTPTQTPRSRRDQRPTQTPRAGAAPKPGTYYEDEEGRPLPTPTPAS